MYYVGHVHKEKSHGDKVIVLFIYYLLSLWQILFLMWQIFVYGSSFFFQHNIHFHPPPNYYFERKQRSHVKVRFRESFSELLGNSAGGEKSIFSLIEIMWENGNTAYYRWKLQTDHFLKYFFSLSILFSSICADTSLKFPLFFFQVQPGIYELIQSSFFFKKVLYS